MPRKSLDQFLAADDAKRRSIVGECLRWISVPLIFFSLLGFVWSIPFPEAWENSVPWFNWTFVAIALCTLLYLRFSVLIAVGMFGFMGICQWALVECETRIATPVWKISIVLFIGAWLGEFAANRLEKRDASFVRGVIFPFVGPAWLLNRLYRKVGLSPAAPTTAPKR